MLPLQLAWAWTFWKAQGQTFRNKIIMNLSNKEKENGLTYTGFSRATKLSNIGIIGAISRQDLQSQEDETLTGRRDTTNQSFLANH
jgi:ATP-dependent exoDNAse (exonuclease V) alpha subunit